MKFSTSYRKSMLMHFFLRMRRHYCHVWNRRHWTDSEFAWTLSCFIKVSSVECKFAVSALSSSLAWRYNDAVKLFSYHIAHICRAVMAATVWSSLRGLLVTSAVMDFRRCCWAFAFAVCEGGEWIVGSRWGDCERESVKVGEWQVLLPLYRKTIH